MNKFEIIVLRSLAILLAHVIGANQKMKANDIIDDIREELYKGDVK